MNKPTNHIYQLNSKKLPPKSLFEAVDLLHPSSIAFDKQPKKKLKKLKKTNNLLQSLTDHMIAQLREASCAD
jgi:hypothetical protein